jgi:hypothetical protein
MKIFVSTLVAATLGATTTVISAAAAVKLSLNDQIWSNGDAHGGNGVWRGHRLDTTTSADWGKALPKKRHADAPNLA